MTSGPRWRRYLRFWRPDVEGDVDDEVAYHFELRVAEFIGAGRSRVEAEEAARAQFGDVGQVRSELVAIGRRGVRRADWRDRFDGWTQDLVVAIRGLRRAPLVTAGVLLTLAFGLGANATTFGIVDRLMLRGPDRVTDAGRVRRAYVTGHTWDGHAANPLWSFPQFAAVRDQEHFLAGAAAYSETSFQLGTGYDARSIRGALVTRSYFGMLGVHPALGRFFTADEDRAPAGAHVVILSHQFWQSEFGADSGVVGRDVTLGRAPYRVIGIAADRFAGVDNQRIDAWAPLSTTKMPEWMTRSNTSWLRVIVRLAPGAEAIQAEGAASGAVAAATPAVPAKDSTPPPRVLFRPLWYDQTAQPSPNGQVSLWLSGVAIAMLLIVCANVANLMLARTLRRRQELAIRVAIGIGSTRLLRLLMVEALVLVGSGALLAVGLAVTAGRLLAVRLLPEAMHASSVVDGRVLGMTFLCVLLTTIIVGAFPTAYALRSSFIGGLKAGMREGGGRREVARGILLVAQCALSVALLAGASLFVVSLVHLRRVNLGFDQDAVVRVALAYAAQANPTDTAAAPELQRTRDIAARIRTLPGVSSVGLSSSGPYGNEYGYPLFVPGFDSLPHLAGGGPYIDAVDNAYFTTLGATIRLGRGFQNGDGAGSDPVAVVNETMARTLWPRESAIGHCLVVGPRTGPCRRIVGVVADIHRHGIREEPAMQYYVPLEQYRLDDPAILVRTRLDTARTIDDLNALLRKTPGIRRAYIGSLAGLVAPELRPWQLGATVFEVFGGIALLVAAFGMYSVVAYVVADRRREFGVRLALGASRGRITSRVVAGGLRTTVAGVVVGLGIVVVAGRALDSVLYGVTSRDPYVLSGVVVLLLVVATVATLVPAWRAGGVDPVETLRAE